MSDEEFPGLGFDPAVGDVSAIRGVSRELNGTAEYAGEAHEAITDILKKRGVWTGDAADEFADKLDDLPDLLDDAHSSMTKAGKAMTTWADQLADHQDKAKELERRAQEAVANAEQADTDAQQATAKANTSIAYDPDDAGAARAANEQAQRNADAASEAKRGADSAWDRVETIRNKAKNLREEWEEDARVCRKALDEAADRAPSKGFFESIGDALSGAVEWLGDHLGDIAGIVSAIAGALSFIPVLAPVMGPIAIGAGAVALGTHATEMVVEGKWDDAGAWVELGGMSQV